MAKKTNKEIAIVNPQESTSIEAMITHALDKGADVAVLERMFDLRNKMKAEMARESFNGAMAKFQAECPTIVKTKGVKTKSGVIAYKYAPIDSIVSQVRVALRDNGFSYSTDMELLQDGVKVTVRVTHIHGHSETSEMHVPLGTKTDIMSQSQVVAAAQTFAKRYAFCNAFGILTGDEDTDAVKTDPVIVYDTTPVRKNAKVISTGDDDGTQNKIDPVLQRKNFIKKTVLEQKDAPFLEGHEFVEYVKTYTGLNLKDTSIKNLDNIVERLKAI